MTDVPKPAHPPADPSVKREPREPRAWVVRLGSYLRIFGKPAAEHPDHFIERAKQREAEAEVKLDTFANDVLRRLVLSNADYQREHGHYIVPLAARLLATREALSDELAMAEQSVETLQELKAKWRQIIQERDPEGGPLIENILYWLIEDVTPSLEATEIVRTAGK